MSTPPQSLDLTYHGVQPGERVNVTGPARIFVEKSKRGPTQRQNVTPLRELPSGQGQRWSALQFGWGFNGTGTSAAAHAILTDAMGVEPGDNLREDFAADVLTHLCDEWRLRQSAILRWVRGWYAEHRIDILPSAVVNLPPASPWSRS